MSTSILNPLHTGIFTSARLKSDSSNHYVKQSGPAYALVLVEKMLSSEISPFWKCKVTVNRADMQSLLPEFRSRDGFDAWLREYFPYAGPLSQPEQQLDIILRALQSGQLQLYVIPPASELGGKIEDETSSSSGGGAKSSKLYDKKKAESGGGSSAPAATNNFSGGTPGQGGETQITQSSAESGNGKEKPADKDDKKCGDPISMATGEEVLSLEDFTIPGPLPLVWKRQYCSGQSHMNVGLGYGWSHPFSQSLLVTEERVTYIDGEQRHIHFPIPQANRQSIHVGERLALSQNGNFDFSIQNSDNMVLRFALQGQSKHYAESVKRLRQGKPVRLPLCKMTAENGAFWQMKFEAGQPFLLESNFGRRLHIDSCDGQISAIRQGDYHWVRYEYDKHQDLIKASDGAGGYEAYRYQNHMIAARQFKSGYKLTFDWDQWNHLGRCIRQWGEDGSYRYQFEYDDQQRCTTSHDGRGVVQRFFYDDYGRIIKIIDGEGGVEERSYDEWGNLIKTVAPNGATTEFEYDEYGFVSKRIDPNGHETQWKRDAFRLKEIIDAKQQVWRFHHSSNYPDQAQGRSQKRLSAVENPLGQVVYYEYDPRGYVTRQNSYLKEPVDLKWNREGLLIEEHRNGHKFKYRYDERANLRKIILPNGDQIHYEYDLANRVTHLFKSVKGQITPIESHHFEYDKAGRMNSYTDPLGRVTSYRYGGLSQVEEKIQPDGSRIQYRYDEERNLIALINENGERYRFNYDNNERIIQEIGFDGRKQSYQYNSAGHLIVQRDGDNLVHYERDLTGLLLKKISRKQDQAEAHADTSRFQYDSLGRLTSANNSARELAWEYGKQSTSNRNHFGRPVFEAVVTEWQDTLPLRHVLDQKQRITQTRLFDGRMVDYEYGAFGQLKSLSLNQQPLINQIEYDILGRETQRTMGNGLIAEQSFDITGRLKQHGVYKGVTDKRQTVFHRAYQYDAAGRLNQYSDATRGEVNYHYDQKDRLTSVEGFLQETFAFDPANNILKAEGGESLNPNESDNGSRSGGNFSQGNRLSRFEDKTLEYDDSGNLICQRAGQQARDITKFQYNAENQLLSVTRNGDTVARYQYDVFGRRTKKITARGTTQFYWQGDHLIAEQKSKQSDYRYYLYEPNTFKPLAQIIGSDIFYYHNDHLGTPQDMTNQRGDTVWQVSYAAYGSVVTKQVVEVENNLRFQGQYYDSETGLHYNRHRYYNPSTGQFITQDPVGLLGGLNNYQYAPNPVTWIDPLGLTCKENKYETIPMLDKYVGENMPGHPEWSFFGPDVAVTYLDEHKRKAFEVVIENGLLVHKAGVSKGMPVDTLDAGDAWSGTGKAIFVMDGEGKIYLSNSYPVAEFHHSSFLAGSQVASAGTMNVAGGVILEVSNDSGHYQPPQSLNDQVIKELKDQGLSKEQASKIVRPDYDS